MFRRCIQISTLFLFCGIANAQNVDIKNYSVNNQGQVELEIDASPEKYYILSTIHEPDRTFEYFSSMTLGVDGTLIITERLEAYPVQNYKITEHSIENPDDVDEDGIDDITEFNNMPGQAPFNNAPEIGFTDGTASIDNHETYSEISVINDNIPWAPFLNNQEFAKFAIVDFATNHPKVYFINSNTHYIHADFLIKLGITTNDVVKGEIIYNPNEILPNGVIGRYLFNFTFGEALTFEETQKTYELLAANMPYLNNNLQHFISQSFESDYENNHKADFEGSRITVILESELYEDIDYIPFNQAESFGLLRHMDLNETPNSRDIVLYDAIPNSLPRVGGIITSIIQTPLSHVNLRAIQDKVPNAYIKDPLSLDSIVNLVGKYVYYKVEGEEFTIREADIEEVNEWYEKLRPLEEQIPVRDLSIDKIVSLDSIEFEMSTAFGAKCTNVAVMRKFGFPVGTIPKGYGVPFYYYDEFMKFNGFYEEVETMINDPEFINDLETRIDKLDDFRKKIKNADMPQWMLDDLQVMHESFPEGTSIRCRSSTNNEDLPGFSGAGLYTSKTQHPDEGHISKSIKQVYASMWNFRAYEERDFYRVDHYIAAMGVLCHPNYKDEKSNGVGISIDPIYNTTNTFYLNTQVGEALITNPEENEIPEEILLNEDPEKGYLVLRNSNLVPDNGLVMDEVYLNQMRDYLRVIHDEFAILYNVPGVEGFGMDIEYKVTAADQLIIKQARPWVSFWANIKANKDLSVTKIIHPRSSSDLGAEEQVTIEVSNTGLEPLDSFDIVLMVENEIIETKTITDTIAQQKSAEYQFTSLVDLSELGAYNIQAIVSHDSDGYSSNDTLAIEIEKLYSLEGGLSLVEYRQRCEGDIEITANIVNNGTATFTESKIEVIVNGMVIDTVVYNYNIPYLMDVDVEIRVSENLNEEENTIELKLISLNGETDQIATNNTVSFNPVLIGDFDYVTLVIDPDEYPQESSWTITDTESNVIVQEGYLEDNITSYSESICLRQDNCYSFRLYDSAGDGICCEWGIGSFSILNSDGDTLVVSDGVFTQIYEDEFCIGEIECTLSTEITVDLVTEEGLSDGAISITASGGMEPYTYSIDGGATFQDNGTFDQLAAGNYDVLVRDATSTCFINETVAVEITVAVYDSGYDFIKISPNPFYTRLTIEIADQNIKRIDLIGTKGRQLQSTITNGQKSIVMEYGDIPQGMYLVKIYTEHNIYTKKVMKI